MKNIILNKLSALIAFILIVSVSLNASSHREAPLIANDPLADNVDVYAFRSPDDPNSVTLIATYIPFQLPQGGPNYYTFGENIRYEIHIDNDAAVVGDEVTYRFTFNIVNEDPTTFFNIRLGKQNQKATYTLERSLDGGQTFETIVTDGIVPPNNIGDRSIASAVGLDSDYSTLWNNGIATASTGETVFAGPSDDPFFVDLGGIFDLGDAPRQNGTPVDGVACYNVSTIAIKVPISTLLKAGAPSTPANILDPNYVIGVWASASRPAITTLSSADNPSYEGDWVQVSRLGMPLTNEAVIPIGYKDFWNSITPYEELAETEMDEFFYNPELALYMDDALFGGAVPAFGPLRIQKASLGAFDFSNGSNGVSDLKSGDLTGTAFEAFGDLLLIPGKPRSVDLWPIFHTGVPNAIPYQLATGKAGNPLAAGKPFINNFLPNGGDMLRLNMAVPPTPRDDPNFSSLGLVQAAAIGLTVAPFNTTADLEFIPNMDGFPNGRRLEDDVTRIELQAVGGVVLAAIGLWYDDYDPTSSPSPVTEDLLGVLTYTTGVEANDKPFLSTFPYVAQPYSGTGGCSGEIYEGTPAAETPETALFVSSNTSGNIGVVSFEANQDVSLRTIASGGVDADGIYYDAQRDALFQIDRTNNVLNGYKGVFDALNNRSKPALSTSSSSDFTNARELAVSGDQFVVAQDASDANGMINKFVVYSGNADGLTYEKEHTTSINLWGTQFAGDALFAIIDNSSQLAVFDDFLDFSGSAIEPTRVVEVEGIIRTHGLKVDIDNNIMILTDVGSGTVDDDGALVVVRDYKNAIQDGVVSADEQVRIEGASTLLGNPVDVDLDLSNDMIYVAERANGGGRILGFDINAMGGDLAPSFSRDFAGASAIDFADFADAQAVIIDRFYTSSNTVNTIGVFDVRSDNSITSSNSIRSVSEDADGIHYDFNADLLYELDRTNNVVNVYNNVEQRIANAQVPTLVNSSTSNFINGREIAVIADRLIVTQDASDANGNINKLIVYRLSGTDITYEKEYETDFNLWGIHVEEDVLFAVIDNSNRVAVVNNLFAKPAGSISADVEIEIEGLTRTHGITYNNDEDLMVLTDIGDAALADDGAIVVVQNFLTAIGDQIVEIGEQVRTEGADTHLGNPVDVAINHENGDIYVAERANEGGRVLGFELNQTGGNVVPFFDQLQAGTSAIFFDNQENKIVSTEEENLAFEAIKVYPNPVNDVLFMDLGTDYLSRNGYQAQVTDIMGNVVKSTVLTDSQLRIDVSEFTNGIYILTIMNEVSAYSVKFCKVAR